MFDLDKLSPRAKKCFDVAKQEARRLKHATFDTDHLLLGLLRQEREWLADLLRPYHVDTKHLAQAVESHLGRGEVPSPPKLKVSPELKKALYHSAELTPSGRIEPPHLLLALVETDPDLRAILKNLGVDTQALSEELKTATKPIEPPLKEVKTKPSPTPTLDKYSRDLTALARQGKLGPIVGREREIITMMEILCRRTKRHPLLIGEPGVGKTALAEGLALRIAAGEVPPPLQNKRIVELSLTALTAGAGVIGEFEKRLQTIVKEVQKAGNVILFIDEAHALLGAGGTPGLHDAATILKPALARDEITCIGATTTHDYRKYMEWDGALTRRFQPVRVEEPSRETTLSILEALRPHLEAHFGITIPPEILPQVYDLTKQYLRNRFFPDKAIDLLERAGARAMLRGGADGPRVVDRDVLLSVLSDVTGIPLERLDAGERDRYLHMEEELRKRVIGQDQAIETVARLLRLTKKRLDLKPTRPDGVFLFVGPPGVGKTELAKALTEFLFGDEERLIRLDMSEYSADFTVSRLIGAPPGYVGYDREGQLTGRVRSQPFCVILLDDIDRAHQAVLDLFLQVFDDGHLTDAQGHTVYFSDATIIMTSTVSPDLWEQKRRLGFGPAEEGEEARSSADIVAAIRAEMRRRLPADFLSRVDEIVPFHPLTSETVRRIAAAKLERLVRPRCQREGLEIDFSPAVADYLVQHGFDPQSGARRLERVIQKDILEPLAEQMYRPDWQEAGRVFVDVREGKIKFSFPGKEESEDLPLRQEEVRESKGIPTTHLARGG